MSQDEIVTDVNSGTDELVSSDDLPKIAMGGALVSIIGSFLPWYTLLGQSALGIEGDGVITLIVGIGLLAVLYFRPWEKQTTIVTAVAGAIISLVAIYHVTGLSGFGVYLTLIGGIATLVAGGLGYQNQ